MVSDFLTPVNFVCHLRARLENGKTAVLHIVKLPVTLEPVELPVTLEPGKLTVTFEFVKYIVCT